MAMANCRLSRGCRRSRIPRCSARSARDRLRGSDAARSLSRRSPLRRRARTARQNPDNPPPPEYKLPSMLAEHKGLAVLFAAVCVAFAWYGWRALRDPPCRRRRARRAASALPLATPGRQLPARRRMRRTPPADAASRRSLIYIEAVPETKSRATATWCASACPRRAHRPDNSRFSFECCRGPDR